MLRLGRVLRTTAITGAIVLAGAGCSSGSSSVAGESEETADSGDDATTTEAPDGTAGDGVADGGDGTSPPPLLDYLGFDAGSAGQGEGERRAHEATAGCMAEAGFEWYPPPVMEGATGSERESELAASSSPEAREWASKYGFGISTLSFGQDAVGPDLVGYEVTDSGEQASRDPDVPTDPNGDYYQSLPPDEQETYQDALNGSEGCLQQGLDAMLESIQNNEFLARFGDELMQLDMRITGDPRLREFDQAVLACVAEEGYEIESVPEAQKNIRDELQPIKDAILNPDGPSDLTEGELDEAQRAALAPIQEHEIALALAVFDCGGTADKRNEVREAVQADHERQFIEDHREALDAFVE